MPSVKAEFLYGVNPYQNLKKITDELALIKDVDCILITGDIAHRGEYESYLLVDELLRDISIPIYWLQGNHDYSEVMLQVAKKVKIQSDRSFHIGSTKFILLQTVVRDEDDLSKNKARGYLFDYELKFLNRELEEDNFEQCVVALHHAPVLSNSWMDKRILDNREEFISILEQYPKVKVVLYGHQHIAQQSVQNGVAYISAPPVAYHFNPNGEKFSLLDNKSGYAILDINYIGIIEIHFKYINNS
jgi:Icc protein